ncbi:MAG: alkaline phosphatase D family protein [Verrucomicrobiales bacterium]|nr:alkaline phosphatase D family protein [Verrucomicrobiales bacterium]
MSKIRLFLALALTLPPVSAHAQHDMQRNAMIELGKGDRGDFDKAFVKPKGDAGSEESVMVSILRHLSEGDVDDAISTARESLGSGLLNPARLHAGSGELLERLREHPGFATLPGVEEVGTLIHGPMLGNVTDSEASLWVRTKGACFLSLELSGDADSEVEISEMASTAESDFTAVLTLKGLKADTEYEGFITHGDEKLSPFSFKTRPEEGTGAVFSVAFGGGAGYVPEFHEMWKTIASFEPDALLMLGDNVYIDDPEHVATQHYCYYRRQSEPLWRTLVSEIPVYSIYDDHDFGDNDCSPGPEIEKPAWKRPVLEVFRQNWVNPGYGGGKENPGCWYDFMIGDVQFFMLDGRYYRDQQSGSMLGVFQKQWLLEAMKQSEATFKVLVSPVPFTPNIKPGSKDPWDGFPEEREEIFHFIETENIKGVFLVAADRHRTDLRRIDREQGYPLFEFMSSRLTNKHVHPVVKTPGLIWGYNETCSFGLMEFDTTADDPQVRFRCLDIYGDEQYSHVLKLSEVTGSTN